VIWYSFTDCLFYASLMTHVILVLSVVRMFALAISTSIWTKAVLHVQSWTVQVKTQHAVMRLEEMTSERLKSPMHSLLSFLTSLKVQVHRRQVQARTRIKDSLNVTFSQGKRPAAVESPTPVSKKHKSIVNVPLAEKLRPKEFSDFLGQAHLMEPGSLLSSMLKAEATWSIILWGPPG